MYPFKKSAGSILCGHKAAALPLPTNHEPWIETEPQTRNRVQILGAHPQSLPPTQRDAAREALRRPGKPQGRGEMGLCPTRMLGGGACAPPKDAGEMGLCPPGEATPPCAEGPCTSWRPHSRGGSAGDTIPVLLESGKGGISPTGQLSLLEGRHPQGRDPVILSSMIFRCPKRDSQKVTAQCT